VSKKSTSSFGPSAALGGGSLLVCAVRRCVSGFPRARVGCARGGAVLGPPVGDLDEVRGPFRTRVFLSWPLVVPRGPVSRGLAPREARRGRPGPPEVRPACSIFRASFEALRGVDLVPLLLAEFEQLASSWNFFEDDDIDDDGDDSGDDDLLRGPAPLTEGLRSARLCLPRVRHTFFFIISETLFFHLASFSSL